MSRPIALLLGVRACTFPLAPVFVAVQETEISAAYIGRWQDPAPQGNLPAEGTEPGGTA